MFSRMIVDALAAQFYNENHQSGHCHLIVLKGRESTGSGLNDLNEETKDVSCNGTENRCEVKSGAKRAQATGSLLHTHPISRSSLHRLSVLVFPNSFRAQVVQSFGLGKLINGSRQLFQQQHVQWH